MLIELVVENLAIVASARLEPGAGFVALTGETGAGKSLLLGAVQLLVGERADADAIRTGEASARVEGRFVVEGALARTRLEALLDAWGLSADDGEVVVRREVQREGRSRAWVNQTPVTLGALKELGAILLDLHGQHAHQSLLSSDAQRDLLDRWAGLGDPLAEHGRLYAEWRDAVARRGAFESEAARAAADADAWSFAHDELARAALRPGEDQELASRLARLRHAGRLTQALARAQRALDGDGGGGGADGGGGGALHGIAEAERALREAGAIDPALATLADELHATLAGLSEVSRAVETALDPEDALDPEEAEAAEARHALLERLMKKHRRTLDELIAHRDELAARLARIEDQDGERARLAKRGAEARAALDRAGAALTKQRRAAAKKLEKALPAELVALGIAQGALTVALEPLAEPDAHGAETVEMRFAPNAGEDPRPLAKIASGGELSRVMLALKTVLAAQDGVDSLIFDEVDSGIGGAVARAVGERLARLGRVRQVLCVTHLPIIAAFAQRQFRISKSVAGGRTRAQLERVDGEDRVGELARMLAGDAATETTRRQARELLRLAPLA
jgi:DNA repair protein RecN (Recombination protein N)